MANPPVDYMAVNGKRIVSNDFHIFSIIIIQQNHDKSYHLSTKLAIIKSNSRRICETEFIGGPSTLAAIHSVEREIRKHFLSFHFRAHCRDSQKDKIKKTSANRERG